MTFTDVWHYNAKDIGARVVYDEFFDLAALGMCRVGDRWATSVSAKMQISDIIDLMDTLKEMIEGAMVEWRLSTKKGTWMITPFAGGATLSSIEPDGTFTTMTLPPAELKALESALRERWGSD